MYFTVPPAYQSSARIPHARTAPASCPGAVIPSAISVPAAACVTSLLPSEVHLSPTPTSAYSTFGHASLCWTLAVQPRLSPHLFVVFLCFFFQLFAPSQPLMLLITIANTYTAYGTPPLSLTFYTQVGSGPSIPVSQNPGHIGIPAHANDAC